MGNMEHLAIASVPVQCWGEVYDEAQALRIGTIFPELNKTFYVTEQHTVTGMESASLGTNADARECMLLQIQQVSFMLDDLRLYMDTHPEDKQGLELLKTMVKKRKTLAKEFAKQFYPLTPDCMADIYEEDPASDCYCWVEGPIPWEGACV